ncbi:hypothetical protein GYMLUDRAFT_39443 [Collybiopsis luxurians FD-317 M1]|nr:hypothetical protein GYMLUDRAFT_39443 [Collybiopsis luxurians FD-317 M1]
MSVTMMSRLMFNLHKVTDSGLFSSHITTIQLATDSNFSEFQLENLTVIAALSEASYDEP